MSSLGVLFVLWLFFAASVLGGLVFGRVLAYGSRGGGRGMGHVSSRSDDPSSFWVMMLLCGAITVLLFIATDGFDVFPGLADSFGFGVPLQHGDG